MKNESVYRLPLSGKSPKPTTGGRFRFLSAYGDMIGTSAKHIDYIPAKIHRNGKKWFVFYSYWDEQKGRFKRFKVYENLNRLEGQEREEFAELLKRAINYGLSKGFNPFEFEKSKLQVVKKWTLVQGLNYYKQNIVNRGLRVRSQKIYGSVLKFLYKYLAPVMNEDISKITKNHILAAFRKAKTERKWENSTYNTYITFVRTIFNFLINEEILKENPAMIKFLPESIKRHKYFSDEVFDKIKEKAEPDLLRFLMFLYHTGTRPNEAMQLKYENIDRVKKLLYVPADIAKTRKDGQVPIGDYVLDNFKGEGLIFNEADRHYTRMFAKLKKKLKLDKETTLYAVKHTAAITMAKNKVPPYAMMQFFRHTNLNTTMVYLRGLGLELSWDASKGL